MRYKLLGSSGRRVSEMALGTMAFGEDWGRLDAISAVELGFPNEFIARRRASSFVLGDSADRIDNHRIERSGLPFTARVPILDSTR